MREFNPVLPGEFREMLLKISPAGLQLGIALAFYMDSAGRCWPSSEMLGEMTGLSGRHLIRVRKELAGYGLTWKRRRRKSSIYYWAIFDRGAGVNSAGKVDMSTFGESCQVGCPVENQEVTRTAPLKIKKCQILPLRSDTRGTSLIRKNNTKEQYQKSKPPFSKFRNGGNGNGKFERFETPADRSAAIRRSCGFEKGAV